MRIIVFFTAIVSLLFSSCSSKKEIQLTKEFLSENDEKVVYLKKAEKSEDTILLSIDNDEYGIANIDSSGISGDTIFLFLSTEEENKQLLAVSNTKDATLKLCQYYPETSCFFPDDLVCFVYQMIPDAYPLSSAYSITSYFYDFKNDIYKEDLMDKWIPMHNFYYQKPSFYKGSNLPSEYINNWDLFINGIINPDVDTVYYAVWKQADFPINVDFYCSNRKSLSSCCLYTEYGNSGRAISDEFIPCIKQNQNISINVNQNKEQICSLSEKGYEIVLVGERKDSPNYSDYEILISEDDATKNYKLDSIFEFQDKLKKIEICPILNNCACFIITTKEYSYDLSINLKTEDINVYFRESSFSDKKRNYGWE